LIIDNDERNGRGFRTICLIDIRCTNLSISLATRRFTSPIVAVDSKVVWEDENVNVGRALGKGDGLKLG
jgi:hypothetical protein